MDVTDDVPGFAGFNLIEPSDYAARGYPHPLFTKLRREQPVFRWERTQGPPFWAITKYDDLVAIGKDPARFLNGPRIVLQNKPEVEDLFPKTLIQMDPPKHTDYRKAVSKRFTPGKMRHLHADIEKIASEIIDGLLARGLESECDFVHEVSAPLPIAVIGWMLGVPKADWPLLFDWTNRTIGATDPDFQTPGKDSRESSMEAMAELFTYFTHLVAEKRRNPTDDLVSVFAHLEVNGEPIPEIDVLTWCLIIVVAGNETTRNATSGGLLAFVENPEQMRRVQQNPALLPSAVEEIVRWTSPIIHFARTATEDVELRGRKIRKGDVLGLFYPSANRDEEIFEDPFNFRVDRSPNRHIGFGVGEHYCLGAHVARLELEMVFKHLLPRFAEIELAGPVTRLHSALVGGVKSLPIRYRLHANR